MDFTAEYEDHLRASDDGLLTSLKHIGSIFTQSIAEIVHVEDARPRPRSQTAPRGRPTPKIRNVSSQGAAHRRAAAEAPEPSSTSARSPRRTFTPRNQRQASEDRGSSSLLPGVSLFSSWGQKATDFLLALDANFEQMFNGGGSDSEDDSPAPTLGRAASATTASSAQRQGQHGQQQRGASSRAAGGSGQPGASKPATSSSAPDGWSWGEDEEHAQNQPNSQQRQQTPSGVEGYKARSPFEVARARAARTSSAGPTPWPAPPAASAPLASKSPALPSAMHASLRSPGTSASGELVLATSPTQLFPPSVKTELRRQRSAQVQQHQQAAGKGEKEQAAKGEASTSSSAAAAAAPASSNASVLPIRRRPSVARARPSPAAQAAAPAAGEEQASSTQGPAQPKAPVSRVEVERLRKERQKLAQELHKTSKKCADLVNENSRLRGGELDPQLNDAVRLQLEALLAEKARLVQENARLARENEGLQQLLAYTTDHCTAFEGEEQGGEGAGEALGDQCSTAEGEGEDGLLTGSDLPPLASGGGTAPASPQDFPLSPGGSMTGSTQGLENLVAAAASPNMGAEQHARSSQQPSSSASSGDEPCPSPPPPSSAPAREEAGVAPARQQQQQQGKFSGEVASQQDTADVGAVQDVA